MALYGSTDVATTSEAAQWYGLVKGFGDQVFTRQPFVFWSLGEGRRVSTDGGGGEGIAWDAFIGENPNVKPYSGFDTLDLNDWEYATLPRLGWKQYAAPTVVAGIELIKNLPGRSQNFRVQTQKLKNTVATMTKSFGTMCYSDGTASTGLNDADQIDGLGIAVDDGSNSNVSGAVYATLNPSTYSWWVCQADDSTTLITLDAIDDIWLDCDKYAVGSDWIIFTTQRQFRRLKSKLTAQERVIVSPTGQRMRRNGFRTFEYMEMPVVYDPSCPTSAGFISGGAGCLFILNSESIKMVVPPGTEGTIMNQTVAPALAQDPDTQRDVIYYNGWKFRGWQNPDNQDAAVCHMYWYGNLVNMVRRSTGCFRKLSES